MRIAVYHDQQPGGARRALHGFCSVLAERHSIDVFTLSTADQETLKDSDFAGNVVTFAFEPARPRRGRFVLNDLREVDGLSRLDAVNRQVASRIDAGGYDVALVDACQFTFAPQVLANLQTPSVYYCHHGPWRMDSFSGDEDKSLYEKVRALGHGPARRWVELNVRRIDRDMTRAADVVVANSRYTAARLKDECGVSAVLCPPGITIPARQAREELGYVLTAGDLVPHKGHHLVIEALADLPAGSRPELHLVGRGGGSTYRAYLESLAGQRGVRLVLKHSISDGELDAEYRGASVFAFGARQEPLGLVPLEAMARGVPVVAVAEGGVVDTVVDGVTGYLTPAEPAEMARRIAQLLADETSRRAMGDAARAHVEANWSIEKRAPALEDVLVGIAVTQARTAV